MIDYDSISKITDAQLNALEIARKLEQVGRLRAAVDKYILLGNQGLKLAFYRAASILEIGGGDLGVDLRMAAQYYELSGEVPEALLSLGRIYLEEENRDIGKAVDCYTRLSMANHPLSQVAHYRLGILLYLGGHEGKIDLVQAEYHFRIAADMGNIWAKRALATIAFSNGQKLRGSLLVLKAMVVGTILGCLDRSNPRIRPG